MPPQRPTMPPLPEDEPIYLTVVHPYPLHPNLKLHADRRTLALWLACCTGKDVLLALFHRPESPGMVIIEVHRAFDRFDDLLGLHAWSEFLMKPTEEEIDKSSKVFYCTYNTGRLVENNGWNRIDIKEHWFHGWTPDNSVIKYPYPKTSYCDVPFEATTGAPICRPLPRISLPVPPPAPAPPVGCAELIAARNANTSASPAPSSAKKGKNGRAAPSDTASPPVLSPDPSDSIGPARRQPYDQGGPVEPLRTYESDEDDLPRHSTVAALSDIFGGDSVPNPLRLGDLEYDLGSRADAAAPAGDDQFQAGGETSLWEDYAKPCRELPTKMHMDGEWTCPQHGPVCSPGICKEWARFKRDVRMRDEREKREEEQKEREFRRAREQQRRGREKAGSMGGRQHSSSSSSSSNTGSDSDTSREGSIAPPDQEEWSVPWNSRGFDMQSTMSSDRRAWDSVAGSGGDDDNHDGGASVATSRVTVPSSATSHSCRTAPLASAISSGPNEGPPSLYNAGPALVSPTPQRPAPDSRSALSAASGHSEFPTTSGNRPSTISSASATDSDSDTGQCPQSALDARSATSSSAQMRRGPATTPASSTMNGFPTFADTEWGDPIAVALAKENGSEGGDKENIGVEGGRRLSKSARERKTKNALAQAQARATQTNLLQSAVEVEVPRGGPGSSWGDPNVVW